MRSRKGLPAKWGKKIKSPLSPRATTTHQAALSLFSLFSRFLHYSPFLRTLSPPSRRQLSFPHSFSTMHSSSTLRAQRLAAPTAGANARRAAPMVVARASASSSASVRAIILKERTNGFLLPAAASLRQNASSEMLSRHSSLERGGEAIREIARCEEQKRECKGNRSPFSSRES